MTEEVKKEKIEESEVKEVVKEGTEEVPVEEIKEIVNVPTEEISEVPKELIEEVAVIEKWKPKTSLGKAVIEGKITNMDEILESGKKIREPEIVDRLLPNLKSELILIGGRGGKGGGAQRTPIRITAKMHSSGRRFRISSFVVVGNEDGLVGIGKGSSAETRVAMEKALKKAKLNLIKIKRGCGSWECGCGAEHSIPYKIKGKSGSVRVELLPAPKGVGLVANNESKKIFKLAGIKDIWMQSLGNTSNLINLMYAIFDAFKKLYVYER
jgi:small subunit ribosomal protein S5